MQFPTRNEFRKGKTMGDFETIIAANFTDSEYVDTINAAVAGATQDVLDNMPRDAWR